MSSQDHTQDDAYPSGGSPLPTGSELTPYGEAQPYVEAGGPDPYAQAGYDQAYPQAGYDQAYPQAGYGDPYAQAGGGDPYSQSGYGDPYAQAGGGDPYSQPGHGQPYAQPAYAQPAYGKSKVAAGILGILLGTLGIHNFYLGYTGKAVAQLLISLLSCGMLVWVSAIWGLVEGILILVAQPGTRPWGVDAQGVPLRD